jgi:RND family efflux transporter MFP subunit
MRTGRVGLIAGWRFAFVVFTLAGCGPTNTLVEPPPPEVTVARPLERPIADTMEFVGTLRATAGVDLRARVNGYLEKIEFEDGADVEANAQLFQIEQAPYIAAVESANAALLKAQAELQLAQSQYRRMEPLVAQRAITQEELDIQAAQVSTSNADVAAAQAALKTAKLNLEYTIIRAPIAGHVGRHLVDIGNLVQAELTLLAQLQSLDPIYAYFDINERDLLRFMEMLRRRQLPDPDKNPPVLYLARANEPDFPHKGHLDYRELGVNESTGTAQRRGIFPNPNRELLPGMFVRIRAQIGDPIPKLMIEERAFGADQRGDYVLIVNDEDVVEYRPVQLGIAADGMRVVEQGLDANDWVIINGLQRARPGEKVRPIKSEMKPTKSRDATQLHAAPAQDQPKATPRTPQEQPAQKQPPQPEPPQSPAPREKTSESTLTPPQDQKNRRR